MTLHLDLLTAECGNIFVTGEVALPKIQPVAERGAAAQPKQTVLGAVIDVDRVFTFGVAFRNRNTCGLARADIEHALPAFRAIERQMSEAKNSLIQGHDLDFTERKRIRTR